MPRVSSLVVVALATLLPRPAPAEPAAEAASRRYPWPRRAAGYQPLSARFAPPAGFQRVKLAAGSFGEWLRGLPLLPAGTPVLAFDGRIILPPGHAALAAVVDLDVGRRDRQQCADTIIRLRGEYLNASGHADDAQFRWAGGKRFAYRDWRQGLRPVQQGRRWSFEARASPRSGYASFRAYLEYLFSWTGTMHLAGEPRPAAGSIQPGDFFIQGGSPGHAVLVLDLARDGAGHTRALIGQGFMPAQDLHVLRGARRGSPGGTDPWFELAPPLPLQTPLWRPFAWTDLRRFR